MPRDESAATNTARTGSHHALTSADGGAQPTPDRPDPPWTSGSQPNQRARKLIGAAYPLRVNFRAA